jgi:hypothetical protein
MRSGSGGPELGLGLFVSGSQFEKSGGSTGGLPRCHREPRLITLHVTANPLPGRRQREARVIHRRSCHNAGDDRPHFRLIAGDQAVVLFLSRVGAIDEQSPDGERHHKKGDDHAPRCQVRRVRGR